MADDRAVMEDVGRYWDALVRQDAGPLPDLNPDLAATIDQVQRMGERPSQGTSDRVWREILTNLDTRRQAESSMLRTVPTNEDATRNSSKEPRFVPATKTRGAWFPANLAT
ncbi:MAG: hypothetical protein U0031_20335, partial [Thermomicrobiales bacterium]